MKHFLFIQKGQLAVDVSKLKRKKIADDLANERQHRVDCVGMSHHCGLYVLCG